MNISSLIVKSLNKSIVPLQWENDFIETKLGTVSEWRDSHSKQLRPDYISVKWNGEYYVCKYVYIQVHIQLLKHIFTHNQNSTNPDNKYTRMTEFYHDTLVSYLENHSYPESEFDGE